MTSKIQLVELAGAVDLASDSTAAIFAFETVQPGALDKLQSAAAFSGVFMKLYCLTLNKINQII